MPHVSRLLRDVGITGAMQRLYLCRNTASPGWQRVCNETRAKSQMVERNVPSRSATVFISPARKCWEGKRGKNRVRFSGRHSFPTDSKSADLGTSPQPIKIQIEPLLAASEVGSKHSPQPRDGRVTDHISVVRREFLLRGAGDFRSMGARRVACDALIKRFGDLLAVAVTA